MASWGDLGWLTGCWSVSSPEEGEEGGADLRMGLSAAYLPSRTPMLSLLGIPFAAVATNVGATQMYLYIYATNGCVCIEAPLAQWESAPLVRFYLLYRHGEVTSSILVGSKQTSSFCNVFFLHQLITNLLVVVTFHVSSFRVSIYLAEIFFFVPS